MALRQRGWTALAFGLAAAISLLGWVSGAAAQIITEYPEPNPPAFPVDITSGPGSALWFAMQDCNGFNCNPIGQIGNITTTSKTITEYSVPEPFYLASGPDGALWFTHAFGIGRITTAGVVTDHPVPAKSFPTGIVAGPDGALWFGDNGTNAIGRMTTSGVITEYALPTGCGVPPGIDIGITLGPDGALWFTLGEPPGEGCFAIGRITTSGAITVYPIPTPPNSFTLPTQIAAGPDGALWFTDQEADAIGRVTTSGTITEYPVPSPNSGLGGIAAGPDGALWFTESNGNKIGRITTAGKITEYPVPTANSDPFAIAAGPDGALWFTEASSGKIGRITTPLSTNTNTSDFNADRKSDILLQNTSGQAEIWLMNGIKITSSGSPGSPAPSWQVIGTGDFFGSLYSDILWQNISTGEVYIWEINGTKVIGGGSPGNPGTSWHAIGTGDFNGDGKSDILLQNTSGQAAIWLMNGVTPISSMALVGANPGPSWHVIGTGDFYDNGYSDILWQNSTSGEVYIWEINGTKVIGGGSPGNPGTSWHVIGSGDFNGDGKADILLQNVSGQAAIWLMNGAAPLTPMTLVGANPGPSWHAIGSGDFYGRGYSDILWQNTTSGEVYIWEINGTKVIGGGSPGNPGTAWHAIGE